MTDDVFADLDLGGIVLGAELRRTDKSLLVHGHRGDRPVVVKILLTQDRFWRQKFAHEIDLYRAFSSSPPPIRVPQLVHTDGAQVLVLEELRGRPVSEQRYPSASLPDRAMEQILEAVSSFALWQPPSHLLPPPAFDYQQRLHREHQHGWLDATEHTALEGLATELDPPATVQHGDPLPSNLLLRPTGCALLDFEFTGLYLAGWDLAMLHTLLVDVPGAAERIDTYRPTACTEHGWLLNRALVLTRERRIHHELPETTPGRRTRLQSLHEAWQALWRELHER